MASYGCDNVDAVAAQEARRIPQSIDVVTAPTSEPVTLDEAKRAAKVDYTEEDSTITAWIKQAREEIEIDASICLMPQTIRVNLDWFPAWSLLIRRYPITAISSITYVDFDGSTQTISSSDYVLDATSFPPRVEPAYGLLWPNARSQPRSVKVTCTAGFASASLVPEIAKQAIRLRVAMNVKEREGMDFEKYQAAYDGLVAKLRRFNML